MRNRKKILLSGSRTSVSPNLFNFFKNVVGDSNFTLQNQLQKEAVYAIPNLAGEERLREIYGFIKQMGKPYIPGTEIKGTIRTAILYCILQDDKDLQNQLSAKLKSFQTQFEKQIALVKNERDLKKMNPLNPRQKLSKLKESIEKEMREISRWLQENILNCKSDAKYDVMKFLQIGDSCLMEPSSVLSVSYVEPFNMSNRFKVFYEYLRPQTEISLTSFCLEKRNALDSKLNNMGFSDSHKQLMGSLDKILACCHRFSSDLLDKEIAYFNKHRKSGIVEHLQQIEKLNTPQEPVLRIGKDEGYNSLTVGLAIKELMPDLYENVLIHATKNKSYDSTHGGPFPKTRKIVKWEDKEELTSGWVQLVSDTPTNTISAQQAGPVDLTALQNKFGSKRGR